MTTLRAMSTTLALRRQVLRAVGRPVLSVLLATAGIAFLIGALQCTPVAAQDTAAVAHEAEPAIPVLIVYLSDDGQATFNGDPVSTETIFVLEPGATVVLPHDGPPYPTVYTRPSHQTRFEGRFRLLFQLPNGDTQELAVENGTVVHYRSHAAARRAGVMAER